MATCSLDDIERSDAREGIKENIRSHSGAASEEFGIE